MMYDLLCSLWFDRSRPAPTDAPSPKQQLEIDALRFLARGLGGILIGVVCVVAIGLPLFVIVPEAMPIVAKVMVIPVIVAILGTIRAAQGVLMLLTGLRIELEGKHRLGGGEKVLTGFFALGWVVSFVGLLALGLKLFA